MHMRDGNAVYQLLTSHKNPKCQIDASQYILIQFLVFTEPF